MLSANDDRPKDKDTADPTRSNINPIMKGDPQLSLT